MRFASSTRWRTAFSEELGAWLVVTEDGQRLRVADDAHGRDFWLTGEESERKTAEEQARRAELAEQELVALLAELARRGPPG